jgi:5,10-methylenetetrahydrofolate reductase
MDESQPKIVDLIHSASEPFYSFEFFPPRTDIGRENL